MHTEPTKERGISKPLTLANEDVCTNLGVKDIQRAKSFYVGLLGLRVIGEESGEELELESGKSSIFVYRSEFAGTNKATAMTWEVDDIEGTIDSLKEKGVTFEHYDLPDTTVEGDVHICDGMKLAWFKDPDGNILGIVGRKGAKPS